VAKCRKYINRKDALNTKTSSEEEERKTKNTLEEKIGGTIGIGNETERRISGSRHKTYLHVARIYTPIARSAMHRNAQCNKKDNSLVLF